VVPLLSKVMMLRRTEGASCRVLTAITRIEKWPNPARVRECIRIVRKFGRPPWYHGAVA